MASINRLSPILALGVGVLHAGLSPVAAVAGVVPNLVLVTAVVLASLVGAGPALVVAFGGALVASLYGGEPVGTVPLALVLVTGAAAVGVRWFGAVGPAYAVAATFLASMLADAATAAFATLAAGGTWPVQAFDVTLRAAALNAAVALVVVTLAAGFTRATRPALR